MAHARGCLPPSPSPSPSPCSLQVSRKYGLANAPKLVEIIAAVPDEHRAVLLPQLRAKPVRTASGIAVVAVMSKPHRCPHIATTGGYVGGVWGGVGGCAKQVGDLGFGGVYGPGGDVDVCVLQGSCGA